MKSCKRFISLFLVAIMSLTLFDMGAVFAEENEPNDSPIVKTSYTATANGEANVTTSDAITLVFEEPVPGLEESNIVLSAGTASATMGSLTVVEGSSDTEYTLGISDVLNEGTVTLKITKDGVDDQEKAIMIYREAALVTYSVANVGGTAFVADSSALRLTFNSAVSELSSDDIILSAGTPAAVTNYASATAEKGALTQVSDTVFELALVNITRTGTLGVQIDKEGIETDKKNVLVNAQVDKTALQPTPPRASFPQNITSLPHSPGLNDLFQFIDSEAGSNGRVTTEADWLERRDELRDLIQYYYYGRKYPTPKSAIIVNEPTNQINVTINDNDRTVTGSLGNVIVPTGTPPEGGWPVIIAFGFGQTAMATENGYAVINVSNWGGFNRSGNYYNLYPFNPYEYDFNTGSIMTAAWTVSRIIDAMEISAEANGGMNQWNINPYKSMTTGVSINGKYALMSAAMDDRVGAAAPVDSGQSGVSSFRYTAEGKLFYYNTPLDRIYRRNQKGLNSIQYFGESFWLGLGTAAAFQQQKDMDYMPFDSHAVEALMAPRPLIAFVADNNFDWTTPPSSVMAMTAAQEVYEFLGSDNAAVRVRDGAHAIQDRDVPFMLAIMEKEFNGKSLQVNNLFPHSDPPSYGIGKYDSIADMSISPYDIDSSYIRWSRPGKYTLWTENEIVTEGVPVSIKVHSDDTKVKLTRLDEDNEPTENTWTADVVDGIAVFNLTEDEVKIGRYEITTVGSAKDSKTVYFQGVDGATALRHGTARNDNGAAVMYGFTSKINKDLVEVYADGRLLSQSPQEDTEQAWILNYGVTTNPNSNNLIPNDAFEVITLKKLQMEAMPGSTFELSIDKSKLENNQETVSWNASESVQRIGPEPNWPPYPNSATDDGNRPLRPETTSNFSADIDFSLNDEVELEAGDKLEITFDEPMHRGDFGIGFDFSNDFVIAWAEDDQTALVTFNHVTKNNGEVGNIYIMRLRDAAGNLIAAPIHHSFTFKSVETEVPAAPTNVTAIAKGTSTIDVSWTASEDASGYNVYRSTSAEGNYVKVNTQLITATKLEDSGLTPKTAYYYKVTAVNDGGESERSTAAYAVTDSIYTGPGIPPATPPAPIASDELKANVDSNGHATATVQAAHLKKALSDAKAGTMKLVVTGVEQAKQVTISMLAEQVKEAKEEGIKRIEVSLGFGVVQLPVSLFEGTAGNANIQLNVAVVDNSTLSEKVREFVGSNKVYDFNLSIGGKKITSFGPGQQVRVEIPYTLKTGEKPHQIVLYYLSDEGNIEVIKHAHYDKHTGMVVFKAKHFSKYAAIANAVRFNDAKAIAWASDSIEGLAARGIVNGVTKDSFAPGKSVTRAEFVHMLMQTLDLSVANASSSFLDVKQDAWYYSSVATAQQLGIVNGRTDGSFGIYDEITRQEMAAMAYRAIQVAGIALNADKAAAAFQDEQDIAAYAKKAVNAMHEAGIISGVGNNRFAPHGTATRAQAAVILYQLLIESL
ncbi:S-layer homology domain-containing protein [Paenibacillus camelliae]|uniref:S-layer homology domain-containing protein n=1 Tax=Paenibacillus camelliae TaxID=512410 RepID=UPI00203D9904|nr:S-layer homology domain-containing protein [Paenibacillus camelliae]MCM3634240.1 S-layer homology domain-containing protein [Paenibacillus camelliae]